VFSVDGRLVARLVDGVRPAGRNRVAWRALDGRGAPVASGIYFYRLETGGNTFTKKMVLLR
jgi:hypothetical protein